MGFSPAPTTIGFAHRSAEYLANNGYRRPEIARVLVDELDVSPRDALDVVNELAA